MNWQLLGPTNLGGCSRNVTSVPLDDSCRLVARGMGRVSRGSITEPPRGALPAAAAWSKQPRLRSQTRPPGPHNATRCWLPANRRSSPPPCGTRCRLPRPKRVPTCCPAPGRHQSLVNLRGNGIWGNRIATHPTHSPLPLPLCPLPIAPSSRNPSLSVVILRRTNKAVTVNHHGWWPHRLLPRHRSVSPLLVLHG